VWPAARLSDVEHLLDTDLLPRILSFSGHGFCGYLYFHDELSLDGRPKVPSADAFIRLVAPGNAPELQGIFLNACKSEAIAREIHRALPHLSIVCWRGLALNAAAKAFSRGFYAALAERTQVPVSTAYDAGRARLLQEGFREGDPEDYLHPRHHEHNLPTHVRSGPGWASCAGCCPPVHGEVILVTSSQTKTPSAKSRDRSNSVPSSVDTKCSRSGSG